MNIVVYFFKRSADFILLSVIGDTAAEMSVNGIKKPLASRIQRNIRCTMFPPAGQTAIQVEAIGGPDEG